MADKRYGENKSQREQLDAIDYGMLGDSGTTQPTMVPTYQPSPEETKAKVEKSISLMSAEEKASYYSKKASKRGY